MVLQIFFGSKPTNTGKNPAECLQIPFRSFDVKNNFWKRYYFKKCSINTISGMIFNLPENEQSNTDAGSSASWPCCAFKVVFSWKRRPGEAAHGQRGSFRSVIDTHVTWVRFLFLELEMRRVKIKQEKMGLGVLVIEQIYQQLQSAGRKR